MKNAYFEKETTFSSFKADFIIWMLLALFAFSSCSGKRGYIKYSNNHPEVLAADCLIKFPAKSEFRPGRIDTIPGERIYIKGDSIQCPEVPQGKPAPKVKVPDKLFDCPPTMICIPDTVIKVDSSALFLLSNAKRDIISKNEKISELKSDKVWLTISGVILFAIMCLFAFLWIRK